jgi:hypothetical protein
MIRRSPILSTRPMPPSADQMIHPDFNNGVVCARVSMVDEVQNNERFRQHLHVRSCC